MSHTKIRRGPEQVSRNTTKSSAEGPSPANTPKQPGIKKTEEQEEIEEGNKNFQAESAGYVNALFNPKEKQGYYYSEDGALVFHGSDKSNKDVYVVEKNKNSWDYDNATKLKVDYDNFLKLAGVIHVESSGDKKEAFALGTAIINASINGGQSVTYLIGNSNFTKAILNSKFTAYINSPNNDKFALSATINAMLYQMGLGTDYSNGAVMWEGGELAAKGGSQHKPSFYGTSIDQNDWTSFSDYWTKNSKALKRDYGKEKVADISDKYDKKAKSYEMKATYGNKGKTLLKSTAVYAGTIFFGPNKTEENKDYNWKYLSVYTKPKK